jgi:hypothetical protein
MLHSRYASPYLEVLSATQFTVGFCFYILNIGEIVLESGNTYSLIHRIMKAPMR